MWPLAKRDAEEDFSEGFSTYREVDAAIREDTSNHNVRSRQLSMRAESKRHPASCVNLQLKSHHLLFIMVPAKVYHV